MKIHLKEIEVEKRLAIEYYPIDSKKVNINENDSVETKESYLSSSKENLNNNLVKKEDKLPIRKKSNFVSMSMIAISKNQKSNPTPKSKTIHGFFETIFENDDQKQNSNPLPVKSKAKKRTLMSSGLIDNNNDCIQTKVSREESNIDSEDEILINALTKWEKSNKF
ncbi:unnamed protein product [Brachionus calyciflorus]|uniref:Uncharacterized protein n=1 Tax=Brachionus calyciflorus TaxID=104777 RepID=A0A814P053_9BILA|nr:unnamed protein product [Brachionus calyciflorus]